MVGRPLSVNPGSGHCLQGIGNLLFPGFTPSGSFDSGQVVAQVGPYPVGDPEEFGFPGHILLSSEHGLLAAQMNRLRTMAREAELAAIQAFWDGQRLTREDLVTALNRLSSYFYVLQLRAARH